MSHQSGTTRIRRVSVYCGSSNNVDPIYTEAAARLGQLLARAGWDLVYGGGSVGLMGRLAESVHRHGGHVHGVITRKLVALESAAADLSCDQLEIVETMRQRRQRMEELADAFIVLPGGIGTFEEFLEVLVGRVVEEHAKPIVLVNTNRYFAPFARLVDHGVSEGFVRPAVRRLYALVDLPDDAIAALDGDGDDHSSFSPDDLIPSRQRI